MFFGGNCHFDKDETASLTLTLNFTLILNLALILTLMFKIGFGMGAGRYFTQTNILKLGDIWNSCPTRFLRKERYLPVPLHCFDRRNLTLTLNTVLILTLTVSLKC